jgi:hypothetical protein
MNLRFGQKFKDKYLNLNRGQKFHSKATKNYLTYKAGENP